MTLSIFNKRYFYSLASTFILLLALFMSSTALVAAEKKNNTYEDSDIYLRFVYRSADQLAAFYEGREFPKTAINRITQSCYVTAIIKNKTDDVLWIELDNWVFKNKDKTINRYERSYWLKQWEDVKLKQAHRSTFGWTLMPEARDLLPGESVAGNITIPMQTQHFSLTINFVTGKDKKGKVKTLQFNDMRCKVEEQQ